MDPAIVFELDGRRTVVQLDKSELSVGRAPTNDIIIDRRYISRRHAVIRQEGGSWRVYDLGSKCGTRINEEKELDRPLGHGDRIVLQDVELLFVEELRDDEENASEVPRATVCLTPMSDLTRTSSQAVYQSAVDFSELASGARDEDRLQRLLTLVSRSSETILSCATLDEAFSGVLDLVFEHLPVQRGCVMLRDAEDRDPVARCVRQDGVSGDDSEIQFSRTIAEKVLTEKVGVLTTDAMTDGRFAAGASIMQLGIRSAMAAPIWFGDRVEGLIYADTLQRARAFDKSDLDLLSALGNHLAIAIERSRLEESVLLQKLVRRRLERYHSPAVVDRIARDPAAADLLAAEERDVTVLFADVVGFTRRCEGMEPRTVAEMLNRYFSEMTEAVFHHHGTLDKFIGDCLMAVFGAPLEDPDHAVHAVEAALEMRESLMELNAPLAEADRVEFRVGIHSGRVVAGDIGSPRRTDYTVLGATVNLASRIEATVAGPGQVVVSGETLAALGAGFDTRALGAQELKGISEPVECFEILGRPTDGVGHS